MYRTAGYSGIIWVILCCIVGIPTRLRFSGKQHRHSYCGMLSRLRARLFRSCRQVLGSTIPVGISTLLWFVPAGSASAELLQDDGFERSTANGSVPDSGFWVTSWHPDTARTIVTSTAARSGQSGLWAYTSSGIDGSWADVYQQIPASPGDQYTGRSWVRVRSDEGRVNESFCAVHLIFMNAAGVAIGEYRSSHLSTTAPV